MFKIERRRNLLIVQGTRGVDNGATGDSLTGFHILRNGFATYRHGFNSGMLTFMYVFWFLVSWRQKCIHQGLVDMGGWILLEVLLVDPRSWATSHQKWVSVLAYCRSAHPKTLLPGDPLWKVLSSM